MQPIFDDAPADHDSDRVRHLFSYIENQRQLFNATHRTSELVLPEALEYRPQEGRAVAA